MADKLSPHDLAEILRKKAEARAAKESEAGNPSGPSPESRAELKEVLESIQKTRGREGAENTGEEQVPLQTPSPSLDALPKKHPLRVEVASRMRRARRSGYEGAKASTHVELGATTAKLTRLEAELDVASEALAKEKERSGAQIQEIQTRLNHAIEKGSFDTERARQLGDELAAARATATKQESDLNARISSLSKDHEKTVVQMRKEVTQHAARVRTLEGELQNARAQGTEGTAAQKALREELKRLTAETQTASERLTESAQEIKKLRQTHHGTSAELRDMAEALARLGQEARSSTDFEAALAQHLSAQEDQAARIGRLEAAITGREERIKELEGTIAGAKNEEEKRVGEYHHEIKRRDAMIARWGDVSETLDAIESIFQDPNVLDHSEARPSLLRLIAHYRPLITQLLKNPREVFLLPDPDEMLSEVKGIRNDLETSMGMRTEASAPEQVELSLETETQSPSEDSPRSAAKAEDDSTTLSSSEQAAAESNTIANSDEVRKTPLGRFSKWLRRS